MAAATRYVLPWPTLWEDGAASRNRYTKGVNCSDNCGRWIWADDAFMGATLERPRVHMAFRDIMRRGMGDAITDQKVKEALNANIKEAVADALRDPEFTLIARETVKDALRDRDVHRAALEGAMGNLSVKLNPFRRSNDEAASPRGRADSDGARSPPPPA